jgi:hypothetical protein
VNTKRVVLWGLTCDRDHRFIWTWGVPPWGCSWTRNAEGHTLMMTRLEGPRRDPVEWIASPAETLPQAVAWSVGYATARGLPETLAALADRPAPKINGTPRGPRRPKKGVKK